MPWCGWRWPSESFPVFVDRVRRRFWKIVPHRLGVDRDYVPQPLSLERSLHIAYCGRCGRTKDYDWYAHNVRRQAA